jgi:hypothetical protein
VKLMPVEDTKGVVGFIFSSVDVVEFLYKAADVKLVVLADELVTFI